MDNKILTEEAKETEKKAGKEVENGVSASDEAIKAVEAMKAAASAQQAEEDAVYIEPGMAWRKTLKSLEEEIEKELNDGIVSGKLDAVFLPKDIVFPEKSRYHTKIVTVDCTSVTMRYGGAAIAPITPGRTRQMMVWPKERSDFLVSAFAACLTNRLEAEAAKPKSMIS